MCHFNLVPPSSPLPQKKVPHCFGKSRSNIKLHVLCSFVLIYSVYPIDLVTLTDQWIRKIKVRKNFTLSAISALILFYA